MYTGLLQERKIAMSLRTQHDLAELRAASPSAEVLHLQAGVQHGDRDDLTRDHKPAVSAICISHTPSKS